MNKRLYIANIPYPAQEDDLKQIFRKVGLVSKVEIVKDQTGRSKGFGFVEMSNSEEATAAVNKLNGYTLNINGSERNLYVKEANS